MVGYVTQPISATMISKLQAKIQAGGNLAMSSQLCSNDGLELSLNANIFGPGGVFLVGSGPTSTAGVLRLEIEDVTPGRAGQAWTPSLQVMSCLHGYCLPSSPLMFASFVFSCPKLEV